MNFEINWLGLIYVILGMIAGFALALAAMQLGWITLPIT